MAKKNEAVTDATMSVPEAGAMFGLSRNGSYDAARRGEIYTIPFGKLKRVPRAWVERILAGDAPQQVKRTA